MAPSITHPDSSQLSKPRQEAPETNTSPTPTSGLLTPTSTQQQPHWTPQTVLSTLPSHSQPTLHTTTPTPFFHLLSRLKTTKREGWRRFGISHGESIADHMYRMAILTMLAPSGLISRLQLDIHKCTKMALVHDMAESLVGDITPIDGVLKSEKSRREAETMDYLTSELLGRVDGGVAGRDLRAVWQEYEDGRTNEAKFVKDIDKMELVLQMVEYEKAGEGRLDLGEFSWVAQRIVMPEVREWCDEVLKEREVYWKSLGMVPKGAAMRPEREALQKEYYNGDGEAEATNGHENGH